MINPYANVDFATAERILSVSHHHLSHNKNLTASNFNGIYNSGVRHFAFSRYRPSIVTYPFDYDNNTFEYVANSFDSKENAETLKETDAVTIQIQSDVIGCPNAEHVYPHILYDGKWNKWSDIHINGIGSLFESFIVPDELRGYRASIGVNMPYSDAITAILGQLQYQDGGGVIINHPRWSKNRTTLKKAWLIDDPDIEPGAFIMERFIEDCLDYDPRVLGTDVIEGASFSSFVEDNQLIDSILMTGRRCWIFCQADWDTKRRWKGRNELLIPPNLSRTEQEYACLKAYRDGAFFGRWANSDLAIKNISFVDNLFSIRTENADGIKIVIDKQVTETQGNGIDLYVPSTATYVRAMAYKNRDDDPDWGYLDTDLYKDIVLTNPIMINPQTYEYDPAYDGEGGDDPTPPFPVYDRNKRGIWFWG